MKNSKPQFVYLYKAYAHLRSKHWVVRAGLQFGADFMAYRHHPALVHSDYAVVVIWEMQEQRLNTWAEMQAMSRLCGSVAKVHEKILQMGALSKFSSMQILLCYSPTNSPSFVFCSTESCISSYFVFTYHDYTSMGEVKQLCECNLVQGLELNSQGETIFDAEQCGFSVQTLLLLHIIPNRETVDDSSPLCIHGFSVKVMEVRRWFPEKNREEHCQGMSQASRGDQKTKV